MTIITFNVGGKRFQVNETTIINSIFAKETDLLSMLLRNHKKFSDENLGEISIGRNLGEIFIDRDPKIFRWILYVYRCDDVVTHKTVGISKEMWDKELNYFGLYEFVVEEDDTIQSNVKRKTDNTNEQELIDAYYEHLSKKHKNNITKVDKQNEAYNSRKPKFLNLITSMYNYGKLTFVKRGSNGPYINLQKITNLDYEYDPEWIYQYKKEINDYANTLGYSVDISPLCLIDNTLKYAYPPASNIQTLTRHHKISVTLSLFWITE
jgi:hypothetical protein